MKPHVWNESFEERLVTYTQELEGRFIVIEHVPASLDDGLLAVNADSSHSIQPGMNGRSTRRRTQHADPYRSLGPGNWGSLKLPIDRSAVQAAMAHCPHRMLTGQTRQVI